VIRATLHCLREGLDLKGAFLARIDGESLVVVDGTRADGAPLAPNLSFPLAETFSPNGVEPAQVLDARAEAGFRKLPMREQLGIVSYLGAPVYGQRGLFGSLAAYGDAPRTFADADLDLIVLAAVLLGARLEPAHRADQPRVTAPVMRLATHELGEPMAILRGYADMLRRNEIPLAQLGTVAKRIADQSDNLLRIVEQMLMLARLPMELAFTVRVSLDTLAQAVAEKMRGALQAAGMELRLQLDCSGQVWGDVALLSAALEEMLGNVLQHAPTATTVQLRLRQAAPDRFQMLVKDNGPGISADLLGELFAPMPDATWPPGRLRRGAGVGLLLVREVATAHGGSAWANSVEGKGTTFYLELPAATPDGTDARLPQSIAKASA